MRSWYCLFSFFCRTFNSRRSCFLKVEKLYNYRKSHFLGDKTFLETKINHNAHVIRNQLGYCAGYTPPELFQKSLACAIPEGFNVMTAGLE